MSSAEDAVERTAHAIAARLVGEPDALQAVRAGRNSRVFRVEVARQRFALKLYPAPGSDERLRAEVEALALLEAAGISNVPRTVALDEDRAAGLFTWMDGTVPADVTSSDLDQAVAFLRAVHALRATSFSARIRLAREACLSGDELFRQLDARVGLLLGQSGEPDLARFLTEAVRPALSSLRKRALALMGRRAESGALLSPGLRTLSPSDFGFHNALRDREGNLSFVDFEYFGWDDPVKLVSDVLLHPGYQLDDLQRTNLREELSAVYAPCDPDFGVRLRAYLPLFGVRWVLILLNEFLPERWEQRIHAGAKHEWETVKSVQLERARALMACLGSTHWNSIPLENGR